MLDADKEGFLRSQTSLIQTSGRAARHEKGRVIFYADVVTESIRRTMEITTRRRAIQLAFNEAHGIVPRGVKRSAQSSLRVYDGSGKRDEAAPLAVAEGDDVAAVIAELEDEMQEAANQLEFERAALLRDQIEALKSGEFRKPAAERASKRLYQPAKRGGGKPGRR